MWKEVRMMIAQRYIHKFAAFPQLTPSNAMKLHDSNNSYSTSFGNVLGKALGGASRQLDKKLIGQEVRMKTFKEVARANNNVIKNEVTRSSNWVKNKDRHSVMDEKDKIAEAAIENAAQDLGLAASDLIKLLDLAGITSSDIAERLSGLTGLDEGEHLILSNVIREAVDALTRHSSASQPADHGKTGSGESVSGFSAIKDKSGWISIDVDNLQIDARFSDDSKKFAAELKLKIQEALRRMEQNTKTQAGEATGLLNDNAGDPEPSDNILTAIMQKDDGVETMPNPQEGENELNNEKLFDGFSEEGDSSYSGDQQESGWIESFMDEAHAISRGSEGNDSVETPGHEAFNTSNIVNFEQHLESKSAEIVNQHKDASIPKNEIINQVVEKAKVVLTGEKSEMVMDLKPDSLGKLSLKIVTEHGIVTAKFIAESQQVKQILEANMQVLKDSLEKQGMSVQGFSVSVGQQSSRGSDGDNASEECRRTSIKRMRLTAESAGDFVDMQAVSNALSLCNWGESKINITA
jgi:flagellar hook-length control protein FliK